MNLYKCLKKAQTKDSDSIIALIKKFELTLRKFARRLKYPEAETDLIIDFIVTIQKIDLNRFSEKDEGNLVMYIHRSIKNKCIDLYRKNIKNNQNLVFVPEVHVLKDSSYSNSAESDLIFYDLLSDLTPLQKSVIIMRYHRGYTDDEISKKMGISRQAVGKTRKRAIEALRSQLSPERRW